MGDRHLPTILTTTITRLRRVFAFDLDVFDEVRRDPQATSASAEETIGGPSEREAVKSPDVNAANTLRPSTTSI